MDFSSLTSSALKAATDSGIASSAMNTVKTAVATQGINMAANLIPYSVYAKFPPFKAVCIAYNRLLTDESKLKINNAVASQLDTDLVSKYKLLTKLCKDEKTSLQEFIKENGTVLQPVLSLLNGKVNVNDEESKIKEDLNKPENIDALIAAIEEKKDEINAKYNEIKSQLIPPTSGGTRRRKSKNKNKKSKNKSKKRR